MQKRAFRTVAVGVLTAALASGLWTPTRLEAGCRICQTWKNLRAKCWPKRIGGGGMVVCEFRFSEAKLGFTATEPPPGPETVAYTCAELKATRDVPEREKRRVLREACPASPRPATAQAKRSS